MTMHKALRAFVHYWIFGCLIVGLAVAHSIERCGTLEARAGSGVEMVLLWPMLTAASIVLAVDRYEFPTGCKPK